MSTCREACEVRQQLVTLASSCLPRRCCCESRLLAAGFVYRVLSDLRLARECDAMSLMVDKG